MGGLVAAWAVGEGIIVYRAFKRTHAPPMPGMLLASSALFVMLGLLAESDTARPLAVALAWGFDLAAFMNLAPQITGGAAGAGKATAGASGGSPTASPGVQAL
jgi:hypothetical protein